MKIANQKHNRIDWGRCAMCKARITDNNLGDCIEAEEVLVCSSCSIKHLNSIIAELEAFRKKKEFNQVFELRKKILWVSEKMGHWFDNGDKSIQESVSDYDNYNVFELQLWLIDNEITIVDNLIEDEDGLPTNKYPKLNRLRDNLLELHTRVLSQINIREFFEK